MSGGASCRAQQAESSGRAPSCSASRRRQPGADLPRQGEGFSQHSYPRERDYGELLGWAGARARGEAGRKPQTSAAVSSLLPGWPARARSEAGGAHLRGPSPPFPASLSCHSALRHSVCLSFSLRFFISCNQGNLQGLVPLKGGGRVLLAPCFLLFCLPVALAGRWLCMPARVAQGPGLRTQIRTVVCLHQKFCQGLWGPASPLSQALLLPAPGPVSWASSPPASTLHSPGSQHGTLREGPCHPPHRSQETSASQ